MAMRPRVLERAMARRSWATSGAALRPSARAKVQVAGAPVHQPEPVPLVVLAGGLDQPLAASAGVGTTPGSGSGAARSRPRLAGTDPPDQATQAAAAGPRATARRGRPGSHPAAGRLRGGGIGCDAAAASSVSTLSRFFPPRLLGRLASQHPAGPLAHPPRPVQRDPDRLDPGGMPGHPMQVVGQQPTGPQAAVDPTSCGSSSATRHNSACQPGG